MCACTILPNWPPPHHHLASRDNSVCVRVPPFGLWCCRSFKCRRQLRTHNPSTWPAQRGLYWLNTHAIYKWNICLMCICETCDSRNVGFSDAVTHIQHVRASTMPPILSWKTLLFLLCSVLQIVMWFVLMLLLRYQRVHACVRVHLCGDGVGGLSGFVTNV